MVMRRSVPGPGTWSLPAPHSWADPARGMRDWLKITGNAPTNTSLILTLTVNNRSNNHTFIICCTLKQGHNLFADISVIHNSMFLFQIQTAADVVVVFIFCVMLLIHFIFISDILNKRIKQFKTWSFGLISAALCELNTWSVSRRTRYITAGCIIVVEKRKSNS